jgi:hypothetical protein
MNTDDSVEWKPKTDLEAVVADMIMAYGHVAAPEIIKVVRASDGPLVGNDGQALSRISTLPCDVAAGGVLHDPNDEREVS